MQKLTQELLKDNLSYDEKTGLFTWLKTHVKRRIGAVAGNLNSMGYWVVCIGGQQYLAHRLAWLYVYGELPEFIDHINRIKTDNRIENLRAVTHSQNHENTKTRADNTSGHKGVHFYKATKRWQVYITHQGKRHSLGYRDSFEEAVAAYRHAASEMHTCNPLAQARSSSRT